MDIAIFSAVCSAAFVIIPALWWPRDLRVAKRRAVAGNKTQRGSFTRKPVLAS